MTTYYVVRNKDTGNIVGPAGVSTAPHLYRTAGIAEAKRKTRWQPGDYEVVPVDLVIPGATYLDRMLIERSQLTRNLGKLTDFMKGDKCAYLPVEVRDDLAEQERLMVQLEIVLARRIARAIKEAV